MKENKVIQSAMKISLTDEDMPTKSFEFDRKFRRAPKREVTLSKVDIKLALKNALRYIPEKYHEKYAPIFLKELEEKGRIYAYDFRPEGPLCGKDVSTYPGKFVDAQAMQVMIDNNLDFDICLYPYELVTYGETGQVFQNWMQYKLIMKYLAEMEPDQTLVIESGHPLGLFKSNEYAPRIMITNGLMIGMFDNLNDFMRAAAIGVANYGQMTAGGWMYIGPQGIVHGTFNTIMNAGRKFLDGVTENLKGKLFISSGLGGMSGAQGKAAVISNCASIIAEVDRSRIDTRFEQGWVTSVVETAKEAFESAQKDQKEGKGSAIAFHGNIVDLLEYAVKNNIHIDLLSDQTSCHEPYTGGYCPVEILFDERTRMIAEEPKKFIDLVNKTLVRHYKAIQTLVKNGTYFFDYGNSFMKAIFDAGEKSIAKNGINEYEGFVFPSYVEDIMGPELFDYGYGPFRWVCLSGKDSDLNQTDNAAMKVIEKLMKTRNRYQDLDNYKWIKDAKKNALVVGTRARILYQDAVGRTQIALEFNKMVKDKKVGPIMLGRDHHDVSGTDAPFRETSSVKDGSQVMAEMSVQCWGGNAARGMSLVALHNGGGTGIGKASNGGFGMVLDGSDRVNNILKQAMPWDVMGGVARRAWSRCENSVETCIEWNKNPYNKNDHITLPFFVDDKLIDKLIK